MHCSIMKTVIVWNANPVTAQVGWRRSDSKTVCGAMPPYLTLQYEQRWLRPPVITHWSYAPCIDLCDPDCCPGTPYLRFGDSRRKIHAQDGLYMGMDFNLEALRDQGLHNAYDNVLQSI